MTKRRSNSSPVWSRSKPHVSAKRKNARMCMPGQRVEVVGRSAQLLTQHRRVRTGCVEDCIRSTVWVRLDDGHLWGAHESDIKATRTTQLSVMSKLEGRKANPDPDKIAAASRAYQDALGEFADAVRGGESTKEIDRARRALKTSAKGLKASLGPGRPLTVAASAVGAAVGATIGGPVGAAAGAVVGGATPLAIRTHRDRVKQKAEEAAEARETNPGVRKLKGRLMR